MLHGGFGVEAHAEQQRRPGNLGARGALEHPGRAPARMQSEFLETSIENSGRSRDSDIGGHRQIEPRADCRAIDRGNSGEFAVAHGHEAVVQLFQPRLRSRAARCTQRAEVGACAERLARPGDYDGVHLWVGLGLFDSGAQQRRHLSSHRVAPVGVVDGDERDAVLDAGQHQARLGH